MLMFPDMICKKEAYSTIVARSTCLIAKDIQLEVESDIRWDLGLISQEFAQFLSDPRITFSSRSRVGILCSFRLIRLLSELVPDPLSQHFRLFLETSSVLYNSGDQCDYAGNGHRDVLLARSFVGTRVLKGLERALGSTALARASMNELKALFVMLFGTIIAVSYSEQSKPTKNVGISPYLILRECSLTPISRRN